MRQNKLLLLLVLLVAVATGAWAKTPNSIVINGTPQIGDKSISLTIHFDPANITGLDDGFAPTLKVKCAADNKWDETTLSSTEVSSGTTDISLKNLGEFEAGKTYEVCFAYNNGEWVDEVFQSFVLAATTYSVTLAEGTEDSGKWTIEPKTGLKGGETVTATYNGEKKVKSVKAVKKAAAPALDPAKAYLTWDADQKKLVATEIPAEVTTVENADAGVQWSAGTYVVDGQVKINGEITLTGEVNLIIKDGAKLTAKKIIGGSNKLSIYGQANQTGQLVVDNSGDDATTSIKTFEVHSAKVTATSSKKDRGGFYYTGTINVYGGSVDATAANGYGIWLRPDGSINIYGGEVKAVGKGTGGDGYGIKAGNTATVTVNGGKLWAENADKQALQSYITLKKGEGFSGKIETCDDGSSWDELPIGAMPTTKYVRVGY